QSTRRGHHGIYGARRSSVNAAWRGFAKTLRRADRPRRHSEPMPAMRTKPARGRGRKFAGRAVERNAARGGADVDQNEALRAKRPVAQRAKRKKICADKHFSPRATK